MIDTVIVSGGMIQKDFALDFIRKIEEERKGKKLLLLAADRGLDFFLETGLVPDIVDGDFDSLSGAGKAYLESLDHTEIVRLNPEKDDTDTQSTLNLAIRRGAKNILILGATGGRLDHFIGNMGLLGYGRQKGVNVMLRITSVLWKMAILFEKTVNSENMFPFSQPVKRLKVLL